ncbi:dihydrofolate reductase [Telmatospirillum sp.]|uniref:dihydrofolate reductase n=1 Tax=Telmatospirillum sp. TaxID=2079197 RepID=UPI00284EF106|nr:dihydrofolate reductase [Telmatospirillum sp.]MDR3437679.1 dihydrofolate reductase [Telmatospirillum sp.]
MLSLIVAVAANGVIGRDNQLPWRIPEDLRYFKRVTMGKPVLMGRKTFLSIGKPLPGRTNIVLTRDRAWRSPAGVVVAHDLTEALLEADALCPVGEVMVIGGAMLFNATMARARRLYLTEVHRDYQGDAVFPLPDPAVWREASREDHAGDPPYSFVILDKIEA